MKKVIVFLLVIMTGMSFAAAGDEDTPSNLSVTFDTKDATSGDNASVEFGFTSVENVTAETENPAYSGDFTLTDNDGNDLTIKGSNAENSLYVYWRILSSDSFTIDITSAAMTNDAASSDPLNFTATVRPYTGKTQGSSDVSISKDNSYGTGQQSAVTVYTHSTANGPQVIGQSPIAFETEDAATKAPGTWKTIVTLTYKSIGEVSGF